MITTLRSVGLLVLLGAVACTSAFAVEVVYTTTGTFSNCGAGYTCAGSTLSGPNALTISFAGETPGSVSGSGPADFPANAFFGQFTASGTAGNVKDTVNAEFSLSITQSVPTPVGTETLVDTFAGKISTNSSQVRLTFSGGSGAGGTPVLEADSNPDNPTGVAAYKFQIDGISYWVDQVTNIPSQSAGGIVTIEGDIDASALPEPTFYGLTGVGFAGLLFMAIRRKSQTASSIAA
jgi:hypothetical protein